MINYSNDVQGVCKSIEDYNPGKEHKILVASDDITADIISNKKSNPTVTKLFITGSRVCITQSYFKVPKEVKLKSTHYFIMKIPNKRELQQIAISHLSDMDFKNFMKIYKKCTVEKYSLLVDDTMLPTDDPLLIRNNLFERIL